MGIISGIQVGHLPYIVISPFYVWQACRAALSGWIILLTNDDACYEIRLLVPRPPK